MANNFTKKTSKIPKFRSRTALYHRLKNKNIEIDRPGFDCSNPYHKDRNSTNCAMWQMIFHLPDKSNPMNKENKEKVKSEQGLIGGLSDVDYLVREKSLKLGGLYSYLLIDLNAPGLGGNDEEKVGERLRG